MYEKKLVTYPRTDARVLSTAVAKEISKNLNGLVKGYKDEEEFQDDMKKQIIMSIEIDEMREELSQMQAAHTSEYDFSTYGGK